MTLVAGQARQGFVVDQGGIDQRILRTALGADVASRTATRQGRIASTVGRDGVVSIAQGSVRRFLNADGASHTRALAYQFVFVLVSGFIGLIGLASVLGVEQLRLAVQHMAGTLSPGASGRILQRAAAHGASNGGTAAFFGLAAALTAGTLAMAQVERSANRLADDDDPPRSGGSRAPSCSRSRPDSCWSSVG